MKLKAVEKPEKKVATRSQLGKRSKSKGSNFERTIAKKFKDFFGIDLVRTPQSGGFAKKYAKADDFRGDIVPADKDLNFHLHVECKNQKAWALPSWIKQAEEDCPKDKIPVVVFHQHNTSRDFVALSLEDFFKLVPTERIAERIEQV